MATGVDTLISPAMQEAKGKWGETRRSPPIALSDIRKWAIATYWPETPPQIYWDEDYAKTTRWGGIIAPPDFNPFAWPVRRQAPAGAAGRPGAEGGPRLTSMNGGQTDTFGVPMRPGDVISARSRLQDFNEREGRFGLMLYSFTENEWTNQKGEFVRRRISTSIRY
jgi:acyl dehydratase